MTQKEIHNQRLVNEAQLAVARLHTRRHFLKECAFGFGSLALGSLLQSCGPGSSGSYTSAVPFDPAHPLAPKMPMFPAKAKSVIYLHMAGAPSQLDMFDYKPELMKLNG
ncbi:MAG TPA: DUF1501 domain-containing protein, partial [Flavisolibacter sp.]|nr:DUF1501 domain-containing protein [Flavisolibacter sp.]